MNDNIKTEDDKQYLFNVIKGANNHEIKVWNKFVPMESGVYDQARSITELPNVIGVRLMPDAHVGAGSCVGTVIATKDIVIPATVSVDLGCGMIACQTTLKAQDLPDNLHRLRAEIETMVPVGFDDHSIQRLNGKGHNRTRTVLNNQFKNLKKGLDAIVVKHPGIEKIVKNAEGKAYRQLGSLGGGNHFVECCIAAEDDSVWIMLHSGSRGIGNAIGRYFIDLAGKEIDSQKILLPNRDLAYLKKENLYFDDYVEAAEWAQEYAMRNRIAILELVITAAARHLPKFKIIQEIRSHHNYISKETYNGEELIITRKGAVSAQLDEFGIIPGSMGAKSFIVKGLGNKDSYCSCSHGSGRVMSRSQAKKLFTTLDLEEQTKGVECRKDEGIIDEIPAAYKDLDRVMDSQKDLVEIVHQLKAILCVKG